MPFGWRSARPARKLLGLGYAMPQMEEAIARTTPVSATIAKRSAWVVALVAFGLLWFELIAQLKPEWWLNPQYNYGLIVPVLLVYMLWKRWQTRPDPAAPTSPVLATVMIAVAAALVFPIRLVAEANPDWRLLSWLLAFVVVAISLAIVYLSGGKSWLQH